MISKSRMDGSINHLEEEFFFANIEKLPCFVFTEVLRFLFFVVVLSEFPPVRFWLFSCQKTISLKNIDACFCSFFTYSVTTTSYLRVQKFCNSSIKSLADRCCFTNVLVFMSNRILKFAIF